MLIVMMCVVIGGGSLWMFLADLVGVLPEVWDICQKITCKTSVRQSGLLRKLAFYTFREYIIIYCTYMYNTIYIYI